MKKIMLIFFLILASFLTKRYVIMADEKTYTCYYLNSSTTNQYGAKLILTTGASTSEKTYVTEYGKDVSEDSYNKQNLINWGEHKDFGEDLEFDGQKWFKENKRCFDYVIVVYNLGYAKSIKAYVSDSVHLDNIEKKISTNFSDTNEFKIHVMSLKTDSKPATNNSSTTTEEKVKANCSIFDDKTIDMLQKILNIFRILAPILALVFSAMDFLKAVAAGAKDDLKSAGSRLIKRLIIVALLFFVPTVINLLLTLIGNSNGTCGIS